jgi:hypothetical protein
MSPKIPETKCFDMKEFISVVGSKEVADLRIKDGRLQYRVAEAGNQTINHRKGVKVYADFCSVTGVVNGVIGSAGTVAIAAVAGVGAAAAAGAVVGVAGGVFIQRQMIKGIVGLFNRDKLYEFCNVRFIKEHLNKADNNSNTISVNIIDAAAKNNKSGITVVFYGKDVMAYGNYLKTVYPGVDKRIKVAATNALTLVVPIDELTSKRFAGDFKLLYNTQLMHDTLDAPRIAKAAKMDTSTILQSAKELDELTNKNLSSVEVSTSTGVPAPASSVVPINSNEIFKQYMEKYHISENDMPAEKTRLMSVFHSQTEDELASQLSLML